MLHTSYIELSKSALKNNIEFVKDRCSKSVRYSMVMKANAYGHGIEDIVPLAEQFGVDHFSVFSTAEAQRVCESKSDSSDLMLMGFIDEDFLEWAIEEEVSFYVFTLERLKATCEAARKKEKKARIHLEVETGMHRTGFKEYTFDKVIALIKDNSDHLTIEGICSHMAGAERLQNFPRIKEQIKTFEKVTAYFADQGIEPEYRHMACSAGLLNFPEATYDLVRVGIANYGFWPSSETQMLKVEEKHIEEDPLSRVLSWKSKIMSVDKVKEGEYVSYGKSYLTNRDSNIATVPVGYGYGFSRTLSNNGYVLVKGKRVPVVGSVNMNMMVIDVTDASGVEVGDEVVLIGKQEDEEISVGAFSDMNNSMNYELLTRLPTFIPRKVID